MSTALVALRRPDIKGWPTQRPAPCYATRRATADGPVQFPAAERSNAACYRLVLEGLGQKACRACAGFRNVARQPVGKHRKAGVVLAPVVKVQIPSTVSKHAEFGDTVAGPVADHGRVFGEAQYIMAISAFDSVPPPVPVQVQIPFTVPENAHPDSAISGPVTHHGRVFGEAQYIMAISAFD